MPTNPPHRLWFFSRNFSGFCLSKTLLSILSPLATPGLCRFSLVLASDSACPNPSRCASSGAIFLRCVAWQQLIELPSLVMTWEAPEFSLFCVCLGFASTMIMERGPEYIFDGQGNPKSPFHSAHAAPQIHRVLVLGLYGHLRKEVTCSHGLSGLHDSLPSSSAPARVPVPSAATSWARLPSVPCPTCRVSIQRPCAENAVV